MQLQSLVKEDLKHTFDYPGVPGFTVTLRFLTKNSLRDMSKNFTRTRTKRGQVEEEFDDEGFQEEYVSRAIVDWSGLKYRYLAKLLPVDLNEVEKLAKSEDKNLDDELEYTHENAMTLIQESTDFDGFVTRMMSDVENFTKRQYKENEID